MKIKKYQNAGVLPRLKNFGRRVFNTMNSVSQQASENMRDVRTGTLHSDIKDLQEKGKYEEAQNLAKNYLKADAAGIMLPAIASEFATYGLLGGGLRLGAGTATGYLGEKGLGTAGDYADKKLGTNWIGNTGRIVGGFAGFGVGSNLVNRGLRGLATRGITMHMPQETFMKLRGEGLARAANKIFNTKTVPIGGKEISITPTSSDNGKTYWRLFERPSKINTAETQGRPKDMRFDYNLSEADYKKVLSDANDFAQKYGYSEIKDTPDALKQIQDMYRRHNTFGRTITDPDEFNPVNHHFGPEHRGLTTEQRAKIAATKGYPYTFGEKNPTDRIFVTGSPEALEGYGASEQPTLAVRRSVSLGHNPLKWRQNAEFTLGDWSREMKPNEVRATAKYQGGSHELFLGTGNLSAKPLISPTQLSGAFNKPVNNPQIGWLQQQGFQLQRDNFHNLNIKHDLPRFAGKSVDTTNPTVRQTLVQKYSERYPQFQQTPEKEFVTSVGGYYEVGKIPFTEDLKLHKDLIRRRLDNFNSGWRSEYGYYTDPTTHMGNMYSGESILNKAGENGITVVVPKEKRAGQFGGFYNPSGSRAGESFTTADAWRSKPVRFTQLHESVSHPTDMFVRDIKSDVSGKSVRDLYNRVTQPSDLFPDFKNFFKHNASELWYEGRSTNNEMIKRINEIISKKTGKRLTEVYNNPELLETYMDTNLKTNEQLISFLESMDNGYLADYASLLKAKAGTKEANIYANRIRNMIKILFGMSVPIAVASKQK